jgi:restriction endonuclease S subunit
VPQLQRALGTLGELFQGLPIRNENANGHRSYRLLNIRDLETLEVHANVGEVISPNLSEAALERHILRANDVLITTRTRPIRAGVVTTLENGIAGQNLAVLRPGPEINPYYLAALFSTSYGKALAEPHFSSSSNIPLLNIRTLKELEVPVPNLETQQRIANLALAHEFETQLRQRELEQRHELIDQAIRASLNR